jgi:phosphatidylserine decarboxylase
MRIPLTKYGLPQVVLFPVLTCAVMIALFIFFSPALWLIAGEIVLGLILVWMFSFFRDPHREVPRDEKVLLSPADGKITDISVIDNDGEAGHKALRIGIFLSVFNVHINRAPCSLRIDAVSYKKGAYKNAMSPESGKVNESNDIAATRLAEPRDRLLIRQISGAIARRIVCAAKPGGAYEQGERFGMIKFGSRTELYLPTSEGGRYDIMVNIGDRVRAGLTPLIRYR